MELSVTVDKGVEAAFFAAMDKAYIYTKRTGSEFVNTALYFVLRGAMADTPKSDKEKIRSDLSGPSRINPKAPLAAVILNTLRGPGNGLNGEQMRVEVEKFIKLRQSRRNYIASRWIPALKVIGPATRYKAGAPKAPSMRLNKPATGGARAARPNENPKGYIFATIEKKSGGSEGAYKILNENLNKAIKEETASKLDYVLHKQIEEGIMSAFTGR